MADAILDPHAPPCALARIAHSLRGPPKTEFGDKGVAAIAKGLAKCASLKLLRSAGCLPTSHCGKWMGLRSDIGCTVHARCSHDASIGGVGMTSTGAREIKDAIKGKPLLSLRYADHVVSSGDGARIAHGAFRARPRVRAAGVAWSRARASVAMSLAAPEPRRLPSFCKSARHCSL